jgi:hypothetical protein
LIHRSVNHDSYVPWFELVYRGLCLLIIFELVLELYVLLIARGDLLLVNLSELLRDHRASEHLCVQSVIGICSVVVNLLVKGLPLFKHFLESATEVLWLEVCPRNRTLVLLSVVIVRINAFVIV